MRENLAIQGIKNNKLLTVFSCSFTIIFLLLGFWQIDRAQKKSNSIELFALEQSLPPKELSETSKDWSRVFADGYYDPDHQVLIDNQITAGVVGYKIYSPFYFNENNNFVMVDRGWIKQGKSRAALPNISFISTPSRIVGTLISPEVGVLAGPELLTDAWPKVSQSRSIDVVSDAFIDKPIPQVLVLDPGSKFSEEYIPISPFAISPTKHYGYALQWFTMALVLLGMFIYTLTKENNEK